MVVGINYHPIQVTRLATIVPLHQLEPLMLIYEPDTKKPSQPMLTVRMVSSVKATVTSYDDLDYTI